MSRVDVQLQVGAVTESIKVEALATVLQTGKTDVHSELDKAAVTQLPLPAYQSLFLLVPGASPPRYQNA